MLGAGASPGIFQRALADPIRRSPSGRDLPPLRGGELLPIPDFNDFASEPYVHGIRPHRTGGVRLEVERPPISTPSGPKFLIHNYGHGGGGITLSWGCASKVKDHVAEIFRRELRPLPARPSIAVVGGGVIGLTVATELIRWRPELKVSLYAQNVDHNGRLDVTQTTSWKAGGQFEPSGIWKEYSPEVAGTDRLSVVHDYVRRSAKRIAELRSAGLKRQYGVVDRCNYALQHYSATHEPLGNDAFDRGTPRDVIPEPMYGKLPFRPLCSVYGREYKTWLINPTILLPRLAADLQNAGVRFIRRTFQYQSDVRNLEANIIVNCTGLGAKTLFTDPKMVPIRGQLVVLKNPKLLTYLFSGGCGDNVAYMFARQNDIVIGGTYEKGVDVDENVEEACRYFLGIVSGVFAGDIKPCGLSTMPGPCAMPLT